MSAVDCSSNTGSAVLCSVVAGVERLSVTSSVVLYLSAKNKKEARMIAATAAIQAVDAGTLVPPPVVTTPKAPKVKPVKEKNGIKPAAMDTSEAVVAAAAVPGDGSVTSSGDGATPNPAVSVIDCLANCACRRLVWFSSLTENALLHQYLYHKYIVLVIKIAYALHNG